MSVLNPRQRNVLGKAIAEANTVLQVVKPLEHFASMVPQYAERVSDLRAKRDMVLHVAESLLTAFDSPDIG